MEFFWLILIGLTAGWFAGQFMTGKGFGVTVDLIAGVFGSVLSGNLFERTGLFAESGLIGNLVAAATGAFILLYSMRMVRKV
jgi:uncharacterized membrane protein YeaQ/YmgE (transglycosylase-associated protein family)